MKRIMLCAIVGALLFASCKNRNEVTVAHRNFETDVEPLQNLIFTFDKDLAPDSLLNNWIDSIAYIKFTPEVKGKFKWNSRKELVFSPVIGFSPSTDYSCTLQPSVCIHSKKQYRFSEKIVFPFHTPYLALSTTNGYWTVSKKISGTATLMVTLGFNCKVDPTAVRDLLQLTYNNEAAHFELSTTSVDNNITVGIDGIAKEKAAQIPLNVLINKGLKCAESNYLTKEPMTMAVSVPSPAKLEIKTVTGELNGTETVIHVYTTQAVEEKKLRESIKLDPKLKFETEITENGFYIKGTFAVGQNYSLEIKKELEGLIGGTMESDYKAQVSFGKMEPYVSFVNQKGIYLSSKSSKNVAVNIINMPKVHVMIYRVYENNIMHYLRNGRYGYYEYDEDGEEYRGNGYRYNTYEMQNFGTAVLNQYYETKDLPKKNGISLLNLSFENKTPFKGIYIIEVASSEEQWRRASKLVSVSDIGMITKKTDDEIYVFTNSTKTA